MPAFHTQERLWLTGPRDDPATEVVKDGDPRAAFLLAGEGAPVSAEDAERWGLSRKAQEEDQDADAPGEAKAMAAAEDKAMPGPAEAKRRKTGGNDRPSG